MWANLAACHKKNNFMINLLIFKLFLFIGEKIFQRQYIFKILLEAGNALTKQVLKKEKNSDKSNFVHTIFNRDTLTQGSHQLTLYLMALFYKLAVTFLFIFKFNQDLNF